jgi:transposase
MSTEVQRMQKALTQMNLLLHNVISDITGKTGMAIIRSILGGERNPKVLAQLKDPRIKSSTDRIVKSLEGDYREEHLFCLQQAVEAYDFYRRQVEALDQKIEEHLKRFEPKVDIDSNPLPKPKKNKRAHQGNAPQFDLRILLYQMTGADLTQIDGINASSAHIVISEIGLDMSKFRTEKHLTSYLGLSPNHQITGGKIISNRTRKVFNRAAQVLRMAAMSLKNSKSFLGAFYRRMQNRLGPSKAITATARKLACQIYRMLKYGQNYVDRGEDYYEQKYQERVLNNLKKRAREFGYELTQKSALI